MLKSLFIQIIVVYLCQFLILFGKFKSFTRVAKNETASSFIAISFISGLLTQNSKYLYSFNTTWEYNGSLLSSKDNNSLEYNDTVSRIKSTSLSTIFIELMFSTALCLDLLNVLLLCRTPRFDNSFILS